MGAMISYSMRIRRAENAEALKGLQHSSRDWCPRARATVRVRPQLTRWCHEDSAKWISGPLGSRFAHSRREHEGLWDTVIPLIVEP